MTALWAFFAGPLGKVAGWVAAAVAALVAVLGAFAGAKRIGVQQQQNADLTQALNNAKARQDADAKVDALPSDAVQRELRDQWTRKR